MDVLIADDADDADEAADHLEQSEGWTVRRARTVEAAREIAAAGGLDAAAAAWRLPDGSGLDVLDALQREAPGVPLVLVARGGEAADAWEAIGRGAAGVVERGPDLGPTLAGELDRVTEALEGLGSLAVVDLAVEGPGVGKEAAGEPADAQGLVEDLASDPVRGAVLLEGQGPPVAAAVPEGVDAIDVAARARTVARNVDALARAADTGSRGFMLMIESPQGPLGVAAVPGPRIVVLLYRDDVAGGEALGLLVEASRRAWDALPD